MNALTCRRAVTGRRAVAASVALFLLLLPGCGDPLVVIGDLPGIMRVVAGVPADQPAGGGTPATRSTLSSPRGLAVSDEGVLYLADQRRARILAVRSSGEFSEVVNHSVDCIAGPCMERPSGIALDRAGGLVIADPTGNRVWHVDIESGAAMVIAGVSDGPLPQAGLAATSVRLRSPTGVAVDAAGEVWFSERDGHRVWRIDADGLLVAAVGTGISGFLGDGGAASAARLNLPLGIFIQGPFLYIADAGNQRIREVDLRSQQVRTVAGNGTIGFSGDGHVAPEASLRFPADITATPDGVTLFIADSGNHRVRSVNLRTSIIQTFAGTGGEAFTGNGIEAGATGLGNPAGLALASGSLLFISATDNHLVWRTPTRFF